MDVAVSKLLSQLAPRAQRRVAIQNQKWSCHAARVTQQVPISRSFTTSHTARSTGGQSPGNNFISEDVQQSSYAQPASNLSHSVTTEEKDHFQRVEQESRNKQRQSPWTRAGSDQPPAERLAKDEAALTKGKLLTTPSRMLKFIIPLHPPGSKPGKIEPLALLVHPQQPLSYLERLIQSELPVLEDGKPPAIVFRAEDTDSAVARAANEEDEDPDADLDADELASEDKTRIGGKIMRTGKLNSSKKEDDDLASTRDKEEKPEDPTHPTFVRWSPSTEIGDFIRDAARGKEFGLDIEEIGSIYIDVPSFEDRTYYLRMRLRKASRRILHMADLKHECDKLAHKGAKRLAQMGFAGLVTWWGAVYYLTFKTELGWDVMEPVTYLVGLTSLIGGYMWFLYHNREVSYRSAMNLSISRRQSQLYEHKGFNIQKWEFLVEEGNRLRREIKMVADEYDVDWDETKDEGHQKVANALRAERKKEKKKEKDDDDDDDDDDGDHKDDGEKDEKK